jgi:hypothetical protein
MSESKRRIEVTPPEEISLSEQQKAQDFSRILTRFDEAKKPLPQRKLFQYNQRWFFIAIVIILLIFMILLGFF